MPHYDYQCEKCGKIFEVFHKISENPVESCPDCQGKVKRLISGGSGIIFKGSGFYKTDYKKSAPTCEKKSEHNPNCACCHAAKDGK
jgi:putative FmdB family regulatory protein